MLVRFLNAEWRLSSWIQNNAYCGTHSTIDLTERGTGIGEHHGRHISSVKKKARGWDLGTVIWLEQQVMSLESKVCGTSKAEY